MANLLEHYETLVRGITGDLSCSTKEVAALSGAQAEQLEDWEGSPGIDASVPLVLQQIEAFSDSQAVALSWANEVWTYQELLLRADVIAAHLRSASLGHGDRVGLFFERSGWMIAAMLGVELAGGAYVPLDSSYPEARTREVLEDAAVRAVLTSTDLAEALVAGPWIEISVDELPLSSEPVADLASEESVVGSSPAYVLYTSGSSGRPKGVVVTHDNLRASTHARSLVYDTPPGRFLLVPSIAFDSSVAVIFWTLATGGTLVIPTFEETRDPRQLARVIRREGVTHLLCVPPLYQQMLRLADEHLGSLRTVIVAGESCPSQLAQEHFERHPETRLFNEYGPTEATVWASVHEVTQEDCEREVAIGRPIPGVQIRVLDALDRRVPVGVPGQAVVTGPTVSQGYWGLAEASSERFEAARASGGLRWPTYRTGDLVSWTTDGRLLFRGRADEQVKIRGFRIEPGEITAVLTELEQVEEAAVVARSLSSGSASTTSAGAGHQTDQLVAFLRVKSSPGERGYREHLKARLPDFMVPHRFVEVEELPQLPNGKLDRAALRAFELEPEAQAGLEPPRNEWEERLCSLWQQLLGVETVSPTHNFFELGGHSLLVVEMTDLVERDFGVELAPAVVFENPTVRELAQQVESRQGGRAGRYAHLFPLQPRGTKSPFIMAVPHFFSELLANRFRGERPVYGLRGVSLRSEGNRGRWASMADLAEELVEEVLDRFPGESFTVGGYSFGASMAFEAVRLLEARGVTVHRLYMIAPMPLDFCSLGPLRVQIGGLERPIVRLSKKELWRRFRRDNHPLKFGFYQRLRWLLVTQPWRILLCSVGNARRRFGLEATEGMLYADVRLERFRLHRHYQPLPIRSPATIFNPREGTTNAAATWREQFTGELEVIDVSDPHLGGESIDQAKQIIFDRLGRGADR